MDYDFKNFLHYLGYSHPVGEYLKFILFTKEGPIACFAWSSAPRHIGCMDRFIGWLCLYARKTCILLRITAATFYCPESGYHAWHPANWWATEREVFEYLQHIGLFKPDAKFCPPTIKAVVGN